MSKVTILNLIKIFMLCKMNRCYLIKIGRIKNYNYKITHLIIQNLTTVFLKEYWQKTKEIKQL